MNLFRRGLVICTSALTIMGWFVAPASANTQTMRGGDRIAQTWSHQQYSNGSFRDYVKQLMGSQNRDTYGEAALGAALMQWGLYRHNSSWAKAGIKALNYSFHHPSRNGSISRILEDLVLADAYPTARQRLRGRHWQRFMASWRTRLGSIKVDQKINNNPRPSNQQLLQVLTVARLTSLHLTKSRRRGSVLANPSGYRRLSVRRLKILLKQQADSSNLYDLIGDQPAFPLAYHVLCSAILVKLSGLGWNRLVPGIDQAAINSVRSLSLLTSPRGRVAYSGRSGDESWTLAMNAYLGHWMNNPDSNQAAKQSLQSLAANYSEAHWGTVLIPSLQKSMLRGVRSLDSYVSATAYTGLTLMGLWWDQTVGPRKPGSGHNINRSFSLGKIPMSQIALLRSSSAWAVIRGGNAKGADGRSAPGIIAAEGRGANGWVDLLAGRSISGSLAYQPGPFMLDTIGRGLPRYSAPRIAEDGSLVLVGGYMTQSGLMLPGRMRMTVTADRCGIHVLTSAGPGQQSQMQLLLPTNNLQVSLNEAEWDQAQLHYNKPAILQSTTGPATSLYINTTKLGMTSQLGDGLDFTLQAKGCES